MSVLVYTECREGKFKKSTFELASYASETAKMMGVQSAALVIGKAEPSQLNLLGNYGISKILTVDAEELNIFNTSIYCTVIENIIKNEKFSLLVFPHNNTGKALAPGLSAKLKAGLVTGVVNLPVKTEPFIVTKKIFTGKAFANVIIRTPVKLITLAQNSFMLVESHVQPVIESINADSGKTQNIVIKDLQLLTGKILLNDAEIIVSGGRGMKGPENWQPILDLAELLGAATACSRPVSDEGWRPHTEHVGQTGKIVAPNLYIACGISGAIQHMGGVASAKVIVGINKDKDAPIFETADYGIVGDVFKVLPELINAVKDIKRND